MSHTANAEFLDLPGSTLRRNLMIGLGAAAAFYVADHGAAAYDRRRRSPVPEFIVDDNPGDLTVMTLPGCRTDGRLIADDLREPFSVFGPNIFGVYPRRSFPIFEIGRGMLENARKHPAERKSFVGISMGLKVMALLASDPDYRAALGPVDTVLIEAAPTDLSDVRRKPRAMMEIAMHARNSRTISLLSPLVMGMFPGQHAKNSADPLAEKYLSRHKSTVRTPMDVAAAQGDVINAPLASGALSGWAENVYFISSVDDGVVNGPRAHSKWELIFDREIPYFTDRSRPVGSHAAIPEHPGLAMRLLAGETPQDLLLAS